MEQRYVISLYAFEFAMTEARTAQPSECPKVLWKIATSRTRLSKSRPETPGEDKKRFSSWSSRRAVPLQELLMRGQIAYRSFDKIAHSTHEFRQLLFADHVGHRIVAFRINPLAQHHLDPTCLAEQVIRVAAHAS